MSNEIIVQIFWSDLNQKAQKEIAEKYNTLNGTNWGSEEVEAAENWHYFPIAEIIIPKYNLPKSKKKDGKIVCVEVVR